MCVGGGAQRGYMHVRVYVYVYMYALVCLCLLVHVHVHASVQHVQMLAELAMGGLTLAST